MSNITIRDLGDTYDDFIEVNVSLSEEDSRVDIAKKVDGEDYNGSCYMIHAFYSGKETDITDMMLSYIPTEGGFYEMGIIEKDSEDWKLVENYIKEKKGDKKMKKPTCALIGKNGNIYNLLGIAKRTLRECGMGEEADKMRERVFKSGSYDEALSIISDYVNIV